MIALLPGSAIDGGDRRFAAARVAAIHALGVEGQLDIAEAVDRDDAAAPAERRQLLHDDLAARLGEAGAGIVDAGGDVVGGDGAYEDLADAGRRDGDGAVVGIATGADQR